MFESEKSSTFENENRDYWLEYGIGRVDGTVAEDKFCFMDGTECIKKLGFMIADQGSDMEFYEASGFIGLAPSEDLYESVAFVSQMRKKTWKPIFSIYLADSAYEGQSAI